ncbi:MAG: polyprenyl synthetase family protein [Oligoflexales bacterium]
MKVEVPQTTSSSSVMNSPQQTLAETFQPVLSDIQAIKKALPSLIPCETEAAKRIIEHVTQAPGKCVRPALYLLSCNLVNYQGPHRISMGAVCEYVHTASLLHDDVIDNSPIRRGKPAAQSLWGDEETILVGDLMYATASELMANTGHLSIVKVYAAAIRHMSEAELLQLQHLFNVSMPEKTYFHILRGKTGALMKAACSSAGYLANINENLCFELGEFGMDLGLAFQLIDDALDYKGEQDLFGKPTLADLKEGKITLPVILLRDVMNSEESQKFQNILASSTVSKEDIQWVAQLTEKYKTADKTLERATEITTRALKRLDKFPASDARNHLKSLAESLLNRQI